MAKASKELIQRLREITGLGLMDCKKALEASDNNVEKAVEELRKKGAAVASKRSDKSTSEGIVHAYIHPGSQVGVMVELNCETDFVARTGAISDLAKDLCMHIAAIKPLYLNPEEVDPAFLAKEKEILKEQLAGKPENVIDKIMEGKVNKLYEEVCLLKQKFVKDDKKSIEQVLQEVIAKTGENVKIKRFARFEVGA